MGKGLPMATPWHPVRRDTATDRLTAEMARELFGGGRQGVSRRGLLRTGGVSVLALGGGSLLSGCGTEGAKVEEGSCESTDSSAEEKTITFSNWIGYVDPVKAKDTSTLEKCQQETGIKVDYKNGDVNDNE